MVLHITTSTALYITYLQAKRAALALSVPSILGLPEERYRQDCLAGFGRAEECTAAVGRRVLDVLSNQPGLTSDPVAEAVVRWLKTEITPTSSSTD